MPPRFAIAEPWAENGWEMLSRTEQNQQIFRVEIEDLFLMAF